MKTPSYWNCVVLGILATAVSGCGDEATAANNPPQTKSAITARSFVIDGCDATGVFDISSNDLIDFVAFDKSSFSKVNVQLFSLDKNNVETLIADNQNMSSVDNAMTLMFDQVSNSTSAEQSTSERATERSTVSDEARAENTNTADSCASTLSKTDHVADGSNRVVERTRVSNSTKTSTSNDENNRVRSEETQDGTTSRSSAKTSAHDDTRSTSRTETIDVLDALTAFRETAATFDSATTKSSLTNNNGAVSNDSARAKTRTESETFADQRAESDSENSATSKSETREYSALSNLKEFKAKKLILKLNVRAKTVSSVVRLFTGNGDTIAAHTDFAHEFVSCKL